MNKETNKTILFGLGLRKEELEEEIRKAERSHPTTEKGIIKLSIKKKDLDEELEDIREQIKKREEEK